MWLKKPRYRLEKICTIISVVSIFFSCERSHIMIHQISKGEKERNYSKQVIQVYKNCKYTVPAKSLEWYKKENIFIDFTVVLFGFYTIIT